MLGSLLADQRVDALAADCQQHQVAAELAVARLGLVERLLEAIENNDADHPEGDRGESCAASAPSA